METWIHRETKFAGKIIRVDQGTVRLDDGREAQREVMVHPGGVGILPVLKDAVVLVRQFRIAVGREMLEIPAGKLEHGDTPEGRALAELEEETGFRAGRLESIGRMYPSVGILTEALHLFLAFDLEPVPARPEWDEKIEVVTMPLAEVRAGVRTHAFEDGKTRVALHALLDRLDGR
jgi:ADP-ribose pyrophosphatase